MKKLFIKSISLFFKTILAVSLIFTLTILSATYYLYSEYVLATKTLTSKPLTTCGTPLSKESVPATLIAGILAQEDHLFFYHHGFNWSEVEESIRANLKEKRIVRGASTIDMQVASLCYLSDVKSPWMKKFREIILTKLINDSYSKTEIMRAYLTIAPLIEHSSKTGFERAAWYYFNKPIKELTLDEERALILALRNKERLNPHVLEKRNYMSKYYQISVETSEKKLPAILNQNKNYILKNLYYAYFPELELEEPLLSSENNEPIIDATNLTSNKQKPDGKTLQ